MRALLRFSTTIVPLAVSGLLTLGASAANAENWSYGASSSDAYRARPLQLPIACSGFCMVTLKFESRWVAGEPEFSASEGGRRYLFADARKRDIFAAAPAQYTPLIGGDCPVTLIDAGERVAGQLRHGAMHRRRLIFFASATHAERFAKEPAKYFAGALDVENRQRETEQQGPADAPDPADRAATTDIGLSGYCPVTLKTAGRWQRGGASFPYRWRGLEFRCAGPAEHAALSARPDQYFSAAGGYCPVTYRHTGERERGHADFVAEYRDRLYLFASAEAKQQFLLNPEPYRNIPIHDPPQTMPDESASKPPEDDASATRQL